jgi:hypothetical protein
MSRRLDLEHLGGIPDPFSVDALLTPPAVRPPLGPSPTRNRVRATRLGAAVGAVVYDAGCLWWLQVHVGGRSPGLLALILLLPLAAALAALRVATRKGPHGLGNAALIVAAVALASPLFFALVILSALPGEAPGDTAFWAKAEACMTLSALLAAGPFVLATLAFRHGFATGPAWRGAALGVACGALGTAALSLVCSIATSWHVVVGHGAVMVVAGALGGLSGALLSKA